MSSVKSQSKYKRSLMALLTGSALFFAGCNSADRSNVKVAGGEIDGSNGNPAKYPGTVYVELDGVDFDNKPHLIRNVGTIVDVGLSDRYALILSLADIFEGNSGSAVMPIMKRLKITIFPSNGSQKVTLPEMEMIKAGFFKAGSYDRYFMMSVGVKAVQTGRSTEEAHARVGSIAGRIFFEGELFTEGGRNLRDAFTSYTMLAIPKTDLTFLPANFALKPMGAELRPPNQGLDAAMVGFGERSVGADNSEQNGFALADDLPGVMARNFAPVKGVSTYQGKPTPFSLLIGNRPETASQLWEVTGSGLCGSKDGRNYDTGAAIYINDQFAGFGIKSTTTTSGFQGSLVCGSTSRNQMATLIVSPSCRHFAEFAFRADGFDVAGHPYSAAELTKLGTDADKVSGVLGARFCNK